MNNEWQATTGKAWTVNGKEVTPEGLQLSEGDDWKIGRAMERETSKMREEIRRISRTVAQEEDVATLETVRQELEGILRQLDAVINNRAPEPDSPLTEIIRRVEALESWAYRNGARM